ncbi:rhamnogalacturonan lyase [Neptunitalea lumnitzerae]|uniref:Rhamnogalacturonan endolyase YesW n=1 Tax=Neptunitalea lumnitzerae TaxID=2965509 RepID=A0ABQ5MIU1_9FLAO|nr:rhamnogalacturonan lyase [Neptunitalea sp. Y10]GLB49324.1 rhamnogalacturonan endolyase YesW [Neptunitalea sp. Y10]
MKKYVFIYIINIIVTISNTNAQVQTEYLDRGIIATQKSSNELFVNWRLFKNDPKNISFNLYRKEANRPIHKLNNTPIKQQTWFIDSTFNNGTEYTYLIKTVIKQEENEESGSFTITPTIHAKPYFSIPLKTPKGYTLNDASVADLTGDGQLEIILHQTGKAHDNSHRGLTDPPIFQAYKMDGTLLWEINLGKNIREGAHYTQFLVYDFDGDGKAEMACKTADGTTDALGNIIGDAHQDWRDTNPESKTYGKIIKGPEYLTIFNGENGKAMATVDYIPPRGDLSGWGGVGGNGKNDNTANRADRFTAGVAFLDGKHPSFIMGRGYYGRSVLAAFDYIDGKIISRWIFDSKNRENPYSGMGNHGLSIADVDEDGKDEIVFGAMVVDNNGKGLYSTGFRHGDALHVGDLDPDIEGLEIFNIHEIEDNTTGPGVTLYKAKSGELLFKEAPNRDVGRGVCGNIDTQTKGAQMWWSGNPNLYDIKGNIIGQAPKEVNFLIWWDGDATREILDKNYILKYNQGILLQAEGAVSNNGTKATPVLSGDILGDWREELILRSKDNKELRVYATTYPTNILLPTLLQDRQYRLSLVWQNVGYNQPPHPSFYIGTGMELE